MSATDDAKLARMAEAIAAFFRSMPDEQAAAAVAGHINQFWAPQMRRNFVARFGDDPSPLHPLVRRALPLVRVPAARL